MVGAIVRGLDDDFTAYKVLNVICASVRNTVPADVVIARSASDEAIQAVSREIVWIASLRSQ
jgi:hypothetical protein